MITDYLHQPLGEEITAIGGYYVITEEVRFPVDKREILYLKGFAIMDTSCCGLKGCAFVHVKGFLVDWKIGKDQEGREISKLEPITDDRIQRRIRKLLQMKEVFHQVQFE